MAEGHTGGETLSGGHYRLGSPFTAAARAARDEWGDRDVVAVTLAPEGGDLADGHGPPAPDALTRVARDILRVAGHPHPGLAPARDVAAAADRGLWLVHDLPTGARGLAEDGPAPAPLALRRALILAGALGAAHAARVVHSRIGPDVVLVGDGDAVWLLGAPSGVRPADRPAAEDDDTRALAALLSRAGSDRSEQDLAGRLAAVLDRAARGTPAPPGGLGAALRADLRELAGPEDGAQLDGAPPAEPSIRRTEVVPTATATDLWSPTRPVAVDATPAAATGGGTSGRPTTRVLVPPGPTAPVRPPSGECAGMRARVR